MMKDATRRLRNDGKEIRRRWNGEWKTGERERERERETGD